MEKIGIIAATTNEFESALNSFGECEKKETFCNNPLLIYKSGGKTLYVLNSGVGEIAAAAATQALIDRYDVDLIINFGFVGSLNSKYGRGDLVIVEKIVHYDFDTSVIDKCEIGRYLEFPDVYIPCSPDIAKKVALLGDLPLVVLASADKFVSDENVKSKLVKLYSADICEMEGAGVALTAHRNGVKCLLIKLVSDNADGESAIDFVKAAAKGTGDCGKLIEKVLLYL